MKFMGSSSECAPAGARSKFSVESTTRGQGGLSPTNRDGNANLKVERWLTLGNQLGGDQIYEEDLATRIKARCALLVYGRGIFRSLCLGIQSVLSIRPTLHNKATLLHHFNAFDHLSRVSMVLKIRNVVMERFSEEVDSMCCLYYHSEALWVWALHHHWPRFWHGS